MSVDRAACQVHFHMGRHQHSSHHQGLVATLSLGMQNSFAVCQLKENQAP